MTDWEHGRCAQHDSTESVHFERGEESSVDAALSATGTLTSPQPSPSQKERDIFAIPSASEESTHGCFTTLSMTRTVSFQTLFLVIPSASEESSAWMLRFAQHDTVSMINLSFCKGEGRFGIAKQGEVLDASLCLAITSAVRRQD
jgi:hypothetical protein